MPSSMRARLRSLVLVVLAAASLSATQSAPTSSKPAGPEPRALTPEEAGRVVRGSYSNEVLGLEVRPISGWDILSRGEMNVNEAFGREAMGLKLGVSNRNRVFGMRNGTGANVSVAIVPIPSDAKDIEDRDAKLIEIAKHDLPNPKVSKESVLLSSGPREFTGFRVEYSLQGHTFCQSLQTAVVKGYVLGFTTTAASPQELSATLAELKKVISWK